MAVILVVDDDPTIRLIAREILHAEGHAIVEAGDGSEALKLVSGMPVDLVVLDMLMPNKDGLETIVELRRSHPEVRILAISSGGPMQVGHLLRMAMLFGADETLAKPLRPDSFVRAITRVLSVPRAGGDPEGDAGRLGPASNRQSEQN